MCKQGLGKTLQTISFLGHLKFSLQITGPHLIVVPKSTLDNWAREVAKWVPGFRTVVLQGTKEERAAMIDAEILPQNFDVLITSYEMCLREKSIFKKFSWEYIIIDEAHRIKNVDSLLSQIVRAFTSRGRLLITGTPLQNNLQELWALLNFILPDVFSSAEDFDDWFKGKGGESDSVVQQLHKVLRPFLLRRVKADVEHSLLPKKEVNVYVGMSDMQRKWYKSLLEKDIDAVNGATGKKEGKTRLLNIVMQLRKCCNHPYLFDGAEPGPPFTTDEHLVENAGKMKVLDKLLTLKKKQGSRVLIFSQMSRVLDILEDYCHFRGHEYCRIDGGTAHEDRIAAIDEYNAPGSSKFVFLLTTRAGGLGINLVTADTVVLFDSDWNPQADLQAMDRAHRIGQTKQVWVYRLVTKDAVEERILDRATQKLKLDKLVIQEGRAQQNAKAVSNKDDLLEVIQHGAEKIINSKESMEVDDDIEEILRAGEERTKALHAKYEGLDIDALANFKSDIGTRQWEGQDYAGQGRPGGMLWIEPAKRERKENVSYSENAYFSQALRTSAPKVVKPKALRPPKQHVLHDFQFFPRRLCDLQARELAAFEQEASTLNADGTPNGVEIKEEDRIQPLTTEEVQEKDRLYENEGFKDWNKRHFQLLIRAIADYGRDNIDKIQSEVGKTHEEVEAYLDTFWQRNEEIEDIANHLARINEGDRVRSLRQFEIDMLEDKVKSTKAPMQTLSIIYGQAKGRFTEEEDRFILTRMNHHGFTREEAFDLIKHDISCFPAFRFNWFIKVNSALSSLERAFANICLTVPHT